MKRLVPVLVLLLVGTVLGGTVLREEVAQAAAGKPWEHVIVENDTTQPVPVREQNTDADGRIRVTTSDDVARSAFAFFRSDSFGSSDSHLAKFTVPEGKRLVIQSVSIQAALPSGQELVAATVQAFVNGSLQDHFIAPVATGKSSLGSDLFTASQGAVTIYADGGTEVKLFGVRDAAGGGGILNASVTGYLLDCVEAPCG